MQLRFHFTKPQRGKSKPQLVKPQIKRKLYDIYANLMQFSYHFVKPHFSKQVRQHKQRRCF